MLWLIQSVRNDDVPGEGTLYVPDYRRGAQQPIRNLSIAPMSDSSGRWQGKFELEETKEAVALQEWCENRRRLGMRGLERATIRWADFHRGVAYEYTEAVLDYDRQGFSFDSAKRNK